MTKVIQLIQGRINMLERWIVIENGFDLLVAYASELDFLKILLSHMQENLTVELSKGMQS